jgi:hypothetical protein
VIEKVKRGDYELGFEFPTHKLGRGKSFEGLLRVELIERGKNAVTRDVTGKKRAYFANTDSYRMIVLEDFELPVTQGAKEARFVVTVVRGDASLINFRDLKLYVRPVPVK